MDLSLKELARIFRILSSWEEEPKKPRAALIGGWAVYCYNRYHGSTDVDILTPAGKRDSLIKELKRRHGYEFRALEDGERPHLYKEFGMESADNGKKEKVIIDFINPTDKYQFPGKSDALRHSFIYERLTTAPLGGITVPVPDRTALLVTKLKAAWDRRVKLDFYPRTPDRPYQEGKIIKDYADILALVDPDKGGTELDLTFLNTMLEKHKFLKAVLDRCEISGPAAELYGISPEMGKEIVRRLAGLL